MTTPLELYYQSLDVESFMPDPGQAKVMAHLQQLYEQIITQHANSKPWWRKWLQPKTRPIKGLYLWGGVGIGKTWMMNNFYQCLPQEWQLRLHFHRFMQQVHLQLKQLQGQVNPLTKIAQHFAKQSRVICFDEFFVADITDAMLLANLLQALFEQGVILITTSNVPPDELYKNGLQRGNFLPAIELLKKHTDVIHAESQMDYRLRTLKHAGVYFCPADTYAEQQMRDIFEQLTSGNYSQNDTISIEDRPIVTKRRGTGVIWFEFNALCHVPRSQLDYLDIAQHYHTILISHVPQIKPEQDDIIHYLINMIDIFYDMNVTIIMSAEVPIDELYTEGRLKFEFQRTRSRLLEMQTEEYLSREHLSSSRLHKE